ncbi:hypothetical protein ACIA8B_14840 [Micromonospora chalcea]
MATNAKKNVTTTDPITLAEQALADARALLPTREAEAEQALEEESALKSRLARGDAEVTADSMARARFEIERTAGLVVAAKGSINAAERALSATLAEHEPLLAQWVAESIRANGWSFGLYGVPIHVGKPAPDANALTAWVYQDKPATAEPSGALSGRVNLVIVTPGNEHIEDARLMISGMQNLAREARGECDADSGRHAQGTLIRLSFRGVRAGIPILTPRKHDDPKDAPYTFLRAVIDAGPKDYKPTGSLGRKELAPTIIGTVSEAEQVDIETDGQVVTRTIEAAITMQFVRRDDIEQIAADLVGQWSPGIGRFESVEITGWSTREDIGGRGRMLIFTTVRVRLVLRSRLAR